MHHQILKQSGHVNDFVSIVKTIKTPHQQRPNGIAALPLSGFFSSFFSKSIRDYLHRNCLSGRREGDQQATPLHTNGAACCTVGAGACIVCAVLCAPSF